MAFWFTSDTHFNHANVIEYSSRPFENLEAMTEAIVENWNRVVKPGDTVFHLGDFALSWGKRDKEMIDGLLTRLNGQKWLIIGNHDREEVIRNPRWVSARHYHEIKIDVGGKHKQKIVLSHYPMRSWNNMHYGSWMLHGHSHGNLIDIGGKIVDVGVDVWNFAPISAEALIEYMNRREVLVMDHHRED